MIDVKGTRQSPQDDDPLKRYVFKSMDERSKTPAYIALLLAGIGLYLKSIFPSSSRAESPAPDNAPERDEAQAPTQVALAEPTREAAAPFHRDDDHRPGSGTGPEILSLRKPMSFTMVDWPAFQFRQPSPWSDLFELRKVSFRPSAANDNPVLFAPDAGRGSGGAGSSGGAGNLPQEHPGHSGEGPGAGNNPGDPDDDDDGSPENNRAPRVNGPVYLMDVVSGASLAIALADLLRNVQDPDGDPLMIKNVTVSNGSLSAANGGLLFHSNPGQPGPIVITYDVTDGEFTVRQTAHFSVLRANPIMGTDGDDTLLGTKWADEIKAAGGDDIVDSREGNDVVSAGAGDDHIVAGDGNDIVTSGTGHDIVFAGRGNDHVRGGAGNDRLFGEDGDDMLFGDEGDDRMFGGRGRDLMFGGSGNDHLDGGEDNDTILGEGGDDVAHGGSGDDRIDGGEGDDDLQGGDGNDLVHDGVGKDKVDGGRGNDVVMAALDAAEDSYDGGEDSDTLDYSSASSALMIDFNAGTASGDEIGNDLFSNFEVVRTGSGDDHFLVGYHYKILTGGQGNDIFEFGATDGPLPPSSMVLEITDFQQGDRLRISKHDLFEEVFDELESQFEQIYGENVDEDRARLRYSEDRSEELGQKVIEADIDRDGDWETTIAVNGQHVVVTIEGV